MPNIIDATVVNAAYDTSPNGGRKLVRLDNGWLVAVFQIIELQQQKVVWNVSKDNGTTWSRLTESAIAVGTTNNVSLVSKGNFVYTIGGNGTNIVYDFYFDAVTVLNSRITSNKWIDTGQTAIGNCSLTINEAGTELHATWSSKNSTYPNAFNIRYAKGTIGVDGSVTWGAVEQVTNVNFTTSHFQNPSLVIKDSIPFIIVEYRSGSSYYGITTLTKAYTTKDTDSTSNYLDTYVKSDWGSKYIFHDSYIQASPSAIFVPQSINGLTNGRIWVVWSHSTGVINEALAYSYSDDSGVTWSTAKVYATSSNRSPSITFNKQNKVFVVFEKTILGRQIYKSELDGLAWANVVSVAETTGDRRNPSALVDSSINFESPLFIYQNTGSSKVGFYGSWSVTTISAPEGSIGKVSDKNNLLTYSITSDGEMGEIVEKVNGVVVGTKTEVSGESLYVGLTQEQWDEVKFGKYSLAAPTEISTLIPKFSLWDGLSTNGKILGDYEYVITAPDSSTVSSTVDISCLPNQEYTLNIVTDGYCSVAEYDSSKQPIGSITGGWINNFPITFLTKSNTAFLRVHVGNGYQGAGTYNFRNPVLKLGKSAPLPIEDNKNNTLTIEMGENKWEYTFDKALAEDADILSTVKAVKDSQDTYLPAVKANLAKAVRDKGGVVNGDSSFEEIESGISGIPKGVKNKSGTTTSSLTAQAFAGATGSTASLYYIEVTDLDFEPSFIYAWKASNTGNPTTVLYTKDNYYYGNIANTTLIYSTSRSFVSSTQSPGYVNKGGFKIPIYESNIQVNWTAYE